MRTRENADAFRASKLDPGVQGITRHLAARRLHRHRRGGAALLNEPIMRRKLLQLLLDRRADARERKVEVVVRHCVGDWVITLGT